MTNPGEVTCPAILKLFCSFSTVLFHYFFMEEMRFRC